jgi:hypothetical protein
VAKSKKPFVVELEAKVVVMAFDEASARTKVDRSFARDRAIGADVAATGHVWTHYAGRREDYPGSLDAEPEQRPS